MILLAAALTILVDQAGYASAGPKIALVKGSEARAFSVRRGGAEVLRGTLCAPAFDRDSGDRLQAIDVSSLRTPGDYELRVGDARATVRIASEPYGRLLDLAMLGFKGQRCGAAVDLGPEFPQYAHPACHPTGAFHPSSGRSGPAPSVRGWHDAGDYGRYVVNSGIATGTLLWTAELFGGGSAVSFRAAKTARNPPPTERAAHIRGGSLAVFAARDDTGTRILDEARWNLDWMLTMQDSDGGVWHKQTSAEFAPFVAPQDDRSTSLIIGKGSCATADFAAVMAIASRVYRPSDAPFASRAQAAAERAWGWVSAHPNVVFRNPRDVKTGEYGDRDCSDERLWAAAELDRATGHRGARAYFEAHQAEALRAIRDDAPPNWRSVGALAAWTHWFASPPAARVSIERRSLAAADAIVARARRNAYRIPMTRRDYIWGSNGVAANYALQLLVANAMMPRRDYVDAAADILHYLLGRNTFALSWMTGAGTHSVMHPHHRPSASDGVDAPWPGLLAGGPNAHRNDAVLRALPAGTPPARIYADVQESYASNEVAINWNAPLVFVLAALQKLQGESRPDAGTVSMNGFDARRSAATAASTASGATTSPRRK